MAAESDPMFDDAQELGAVGPAVKRIRIFIQDDKGRNYGVSFSDVSYDPKDPSSLSIPTDAQQHWQKSHEYVLTKRNEEFGADDLNELEKQLCRSSEEQGIYCTIDSEECAGHNQRITKDLLKKLKAEGMRPIELRDKAPKKQIAGKSVGTIVVSDNPNWWDQIKTQRHGGVTDYWLAIDVRSPNPFFQTDEALLPCCTKRAYVNHVVKWMRCFSFIDLIEEEDEETDLYRSMCMILLFGGKRKMEAGPDGMQMKGEAAISRYLPENQAAWKAANMEEARVLPFEDEMEDGSVAYRYLMFPESDDWYEVQHRNFLKNRIRIEMQDTAQWAVLLFYFSVLQFIAGIVLFGVGLIESEGGNKAVLIASVLAGITMALIGAPFGFLASLSGSEIYIQRFMVICQVVLAFLTAFIYTELRFTYDNAIGNTPSRASFGPTAAQNVNKDADDAKGAAALFVSIVALVVNFINIYVSQQALDSINDLASLQDDALVFRYFQVRFTELKKNCEQMAHAEYRAQGYEGPGSMTQFWVRSLSRQCGPGFPDPDDPAHNIEGNEHYERLQRAKTYQTPAVSSGMVDNDLDGEGE